MLTLPVLLAVLLFGGMAHAQDDGSVLETDGGGQEILQSIFVPPIAHAPFSLTLATEWTRPLNNGGTYTLVNRRPIKRDGAGRIYQERWLLTPKGSDIPSRLSWIQIVDPNAHTLYQCNAFQHVCELLTYSGSADVHYQPSLFKSGPLANGKGSRTHEDLGASERAGVPVHGYRDTTTLNPGVLGNDLPMTTVREFYYSAELGINLSSVLDAPQVGRETFTVEEISTTDPDASFFQPPEGYTIVDHRKATLAK
ncbi:MAG TPA: hypothetical protein VNW54_14165 [Granulicella sp.]|nr:hypothetical protein [Granulicella sp.]